MSEQKFHTTPEAVEQRNNWLLKLQFASSESDIKFEDVMKVSENDHGYSFAVARLAGTDRWIGFAIGSLNEQECGLFLLPNFSENYVMGLTDRDYAIKLTGAIAQSFECGYGGVERWFVEESLRGDPEVMRCNACEEIGCRGDCDVGVLLDLLFESQNLKDGEGVIV